MEHEHWYLEVKVCDELGRRKDQLTFPLEIDPAELEKFIQDTLERFYAEE